MIGIAILVLWGISAIITCRLVTRHFLNESSLGEQDAEDVFFALFMGAFAGLLIGPFVVLYLTAMKVWRLDGKALARKIAGESREDRRERLQREIADLDRELGIE